MSKKIVGDIFRSLGEFSDAIENVINEDDNTQNSGVGRFLKSIGGVTDSFENVLDDNENDEG